MSGELVYIVYINNLDKFDGEMHVIKEKEALYDLFSTFDLFQDEETEGHIVKITESGAVEFNGTTDDFIESQDDLDEFMTGEE